MISLKVKMKVAALDSANSFSRWSGQAETFEKISKIIIVKTFSKIIVGFRFKPTYLLSMYYRIYDLTKF